MGGKPGIQFTRVVWFPGVLTICALMWYGIYELARAIF